MALKLVKTNRRKHSSSVGKFRWYPVAGFVAITYMAYYDADLRVFDVSTPLLPVEVGKVETRRDPDCDTAVTVTAFPEYSRESGTPTE
mmetsp:Transcript_19406/g.46573  ORF Transcript_19406/g.46573 Transcript_19406/m.46573 type:complete len:88 (-) Transcript_19406:126-389(-)|eukprot:CAMPEP_0181090904 /NCGR_PEP_ID=MMETSP1071-20121207/8112_1 /TAXON_ID=35127 /ORGANISM="Thalassiosira sp., Strain NH16" /LENGTH=87 /DNA_ID=CAMNT_0023173005 /DNA_START=275 /DNA_END=538 /DNA_ORIENTATION=+